MNVCRAIANILKPLLLGAQLQDDHKAAFFKKQNFI